MKNDAPARRNLIFCFATTVVSVAVSVAASLTVSATAFAAREEIGNEKLSESAEHISKFIAENNSKMTCITQGSVPSKNIYDYLKNPTAGSILENLGENRDGQSIELTSSELVDAQGHASTGVVRLTETPGARPLLGVVVKGAGGNFIGQIFCTNTN